MNELAAATAQESFGHRIFDLTRGALRRDNNGRPVMLGGPSTRAEPNSFRATYLSALHGRRRGAQSNADPRQTVRIHDTACRPAKMAQALDARLCRSPKRRARLCAPARHKFSFGQDVEVAAGVVGSQCTFG